MSEIRDVEKGGQRKIDSVKRRAEREIKNINENHKQHKLELQDSHQSDLRETRFKNRDEISKEIDKKSKILGELRNNLEQSTRLTDKQLKDLRSNSSEEKFKLQERYAFEREKKISDNELHLQELNDRYQSAAGKVNHEGKLEVDKMQNSMHDTITAKEMSLRNKITKQSEDFRSNLNRNETANRAVADKQETDFKNGRFSTNLKQNNELKKMSETHAQHLETKDSEYRKGLQKQDLFFEKKYTDQLKQHNNSFKVLDQNNKNMIEAHKASLTKEISRSASKTDDPFYKFEALKPTLKQFEDRIEVKQDIPDHSKQDLHLTLNGKEVVLTFNRRYADASKTENGTINKINKVESFTTRLQSGYFLDPKSIKSTFEDGVMTYVIKKA
jgi:HSP20 family molecular chaperone IbpA